jgi:inhibitor of KinA
MRIELLGDAAVIAYDLSAKAHLLAAAAQSLPGCVDAVAGYDTVGLYFEAGTLDLPRLRHALPALEVGLGEPTRRAPLRIPVCYEMGEDLAECAGRIGIGAEDLVRIHTGTVYDCFAVGFSPGFPYLGYLDPRISDLPRRPSPRVRVDPGTVAITGRQTGIYPDLSPGGWNLIGRTPLRIVDLESAFFPIAAGDRIEFYRIDEAEFSRSLGERL